MCHCSEKSCFKAQRKDNCTYLLYKTQNRAEKGCTYINKFSWKKKEKSRERRQQNWEICLSIQKKQKKKSLSIISVDWSRPVTTVSTAGAHLPVLFSRVCRLSQSWTEPKVDLTCKATHLLAFLKCNARGFRLREGFPNTQIGYVNGSGNMVLATLNDQWLEHTRYRHQVHSCRKIYITSSLTPDLTPRLRAL